MQAHDGGIFVANGIEFVILRQKQSTSGPRIEVYGVFREERESKEKGVALQRTLYS